MKIWWLAVVFLCLETDGGKAELIKEDPAAIIMQAEESKGEGLPGYEGQIRLMHRDGDDERTQVLHISVANLQGGRTGNSLVEFVEPANTRGQKVLMVKRNMWFIQAGLTKPVPISPRQRLLGGASYGDVAATNFVGDYIPTLQDNTEEMVEDVPCYRLELKAIDEKATYDRILYWVSKSKGLGVKAEFFTLSGKHLKTAYYKYDNKAIHKGKTRSFLSQITIVDAVNREDVTLMEYSKIAVQTFPAAVFDLNLLIN